jgi:circadian clock protein KaiB
MKKPVKAKKSPVSGRLEKKSNSPKWQLKLYVAGQTGRSEVALRNLQVLCDEHLKGRYELEVIDLLIKPELAKGDQIFAVPTLIRKVPKPVRKIIGDLSDMKKVLVGLNIQEIEVP